MDSNIAFGIFKTETACLHNPLSLIPSAVIDLCLKAVFDKTDISKGLPALIKRTLFFSSRVAKASAIAIPGKRCPPVPPPAIIMRINYLPFKLDAPMFIKIPIDAMLNKSDVPP